jgi:hypothetical protein
MSRPFTTRLSSVLAGALLALVISIPTQASASSAAAMRSDAKPPHTRGSQPNLKAVSKKAGPHRRVNKKLSRAKSKRFLKSHSRCGFGNPQVTTYMGWNWYSGGFYELYSVRCHFDLTPTSYLYNFYARQGNGSYSLYGSWTWDREHGWQQTYVITV